MIFGLDRGKTVLIARSPWLYVHLLLLARLLFEQAFHSRAG